MLIYSGYCCMGETGIPTPHFDITGAQLYTGDIVVIYTENYMVDGLTVMVQDEDGFFAMGIKSVMTTGPEDGEKWMVRRVKRHSEVVDGEHWSAYGFNYQEFPHDQN